MFEHAFISSPSCTPSRFAIAAGQWHWRLGDGANLGGSLHADVPVYPDLLKNVGYHVGYSRKGAAPSKHVHRGNDPFGPKFEDFDAFLEQRPDNQPFCFWYGAGEPHRPYCFGTGEKQGLNPADVKLPACLPDDAIVRSDLCDYCFLWRAANTLRRSCTTSARTLNRFRTSPKTPGIPSNFLVFGSSSKPSCVNRAIHAITSQCVFRNVSHDPVRLRSGAGSIPCDLRMLSMVESQMWSPRSVEPYPALLPFLAAFGADRLRCGAITW